MIPTTIDLSKAEHEFTRMVQGEIPFNLDYLAELVEFEGEFEGFWVGFEATCEDCDQPLVYNQCPECKFMPDQNCVLCDGMGGWFSCACEGEAYG